MRMTRLLSLAVVTVSLCASVPVGAQQPVAPPPPQIPYGAPSSLEQAKKVIAGAEAEAKKNGWNVVIAVLVSPHAAPAAALAGQADFAGLVDIGSGRRMYLECHGQGSPTVVLEAGYRASARYWTDDLLRPQAPRTMVLPSLAAATRVCAYDRPGTIAIPEGADDDDVLISRSDAIPQPRPGGRG